MMGRKLAHRIGGRGVSRQQGCLAAATAEVDLSEFAIPAGLWQPFRAAKAIEGVTVFPDPSQRVVLDVIEFQLRN